MPSHPLRRGLDIAHRRGQEHDELFAAPPSDHVARPALFLEQVGHGPQDPVAHGMAPPVVDAFEVIHVRQEDFDRERVVRGPPAHPFRFLQPAPPVQEPGQMVQCREMLEPLLELPIFLFPPLGLGHVGDRLHDLHPIIAGPNRGPLDQEPPPIRQGDLGARRPAGLQRLLGPAESAPSRLSGNIGEAGLSRDLPQEIPPPVVLEEHVPPVRVDQRNDRRAGVHQFPDAKPLLGCGFLCDGLHFPPFKRSGYAA